MAKKDAPANGSGPDEVHVTILVEPGRLHSMLAAWRAGGRLRGALGGRLRGKPGSRLRGALISVALLAAVAGAILGVSRGTERQRHAAGTYAPWLSASARVAHQFGVHVNCPRLTLVSPDRAYARIDFEPTAACGNYGNHVTLILRHTRRAWLPAFEASGWTCPLRQLPQSVVSELELCAQRRAASRAVTGP